jgi:2-C-methyl-D-erythritol 4-phosphate cytidylyltransferase
MTSGRRVAALVLAAGRGERLGHALPKAFVPLRGRTLLARSIDRLLASDVIDWVQPVLASADLGRFASTAGEQESKAVARPVAGGAERQDSMRAGLAALPPEVELVAVHDAARCLVSPEDVRAVVAEGRTHGAAILAERARDTIKRVESGRIVETPDRQLCWAAQTPQVVRRDWLESAVDAAALAGRQATDDAQLVEWVGHVVHVVEAQAPNPKITRPEDLILAEALLDLEAGHGEAFGPRIVEHSR